MMLKLSPDVRISLGLVMLTISALMLANVIGLIPDESTAYIDARKKFSEALAVQLSKTIEMGQIQTAKATLLAVSKRNEDIVSAAIRNSNGRILLKIGKHHLYWHKDKNASISPTHIYIPIFRANREWGKVEIVFRPVEKFSIFGYPINAMFLLIVFIAIVAFVLYRLFLRRTLQHLDPSAVVPDRVKTAMDVLAEGVLILDKNERVVLANSSFAKKLELPQEGLLGKAVHKLNWLKCKEVQTGDLPWTRALSENKTYTGVSLAYTTASKTTITFLINCAPILDEKAKPRGVLVTFDDVSELEKRNSQLQKMLHMLEKSQTEVKKKNVELKDLATKDPLTGCLNRRAFFETFEKEFGEAKKNNTTFICIMLDIDFFKAINDNHGHRVGDQVIQKVAKVMSGALRENDLVCRYGGEEFCLLLRMASDDKAIETAQRIRKDIENIQWDDMGQKEPLKVTVSLGMTSFQHEVSSPVELVEQADKALYMAKRNGRNQVVVWGEHEDVQAEDGTVPLTINSNDDVFSEKQKELNYQDSVTGLPVRAVFLDTIRKVILDKEQSHVHFAILIIDINMFKKINTSFGHTAGDRLLNKISKRLLRTMRDSDMVAHLDFEDNTISRLGGDEFGLLIKEIQGFDKVQGIADRVIQALSEPFYLNDTDVKLTCSVGISFYPADGQTSETLLQNAEIAMYHAKREGRNRFMRYNCDLDTSSAEMLQLEYELTNAIENNQLLVHYQPRVDVKSGHIAGMEALLRWQHPRIDLVPPEKFIPLAEEIGFINEIGDWVLDQACKSTKKWIQMGYSDICISVNVSVLQFKQPNFFEKVMTIINDNQVDPKNIELEVTETTIMENMENVVMTLEKLSHMGVKISIDDFGVGHSSLNYIKRLPVNNLKIDRSFVQNISSDADDAAIVSAIIAMAHAMNLSVTAEGVEDQDQLSYLSDLQCDEIQGYYFSRPVAYEDATKLLSMDQDLYGNKKVSNL